MQIPAISRQEQGSARMWGKTRSGMRKWRKCGLGGSCYCGGPGCQAEGGAEGQESNNQTRGWQGVVGVKVDMEEWC